MHRGFALKARWVLPGSSPPIADGYVTILGDRIVAVGTSVDGCDVDDCDVSNLGDVAIVPGMVNAHTHLEFADLDAPLGEPGMAIPDWIRLVMAHRGATGPAKNSSVIGGLRESVRLGTTGLGDIATQDWRAAARTASGPFPQTVVFHESIAPTAGRVAGATSSAESFLAAEPRSESVRAAISPHAPYTVHRLLLASLVELSQRFGAPLAMHLAESREELELLRSGGGPFRDLLVDADAWDPDPQARFATILDYLKQLAAAPRALVIHGNYLDDAEVDFLAVRADSMSVIYCPRTHDYFRYETYPLAQMLQRGAAVALGTDSRASNPDLGMLAEMQRVRQHHAELPADKVLALGTSAGAKALGLDDQLGTLDAGKLANLAVIQMGGNAREPHEGVLDPGARVVATYLRGQRIGTESGEFPGDSTD